MVGRPPGEPGLWIPRRVFVGPPPSLLLRVRLEGFPGLHPGPIVHRGLTYPYTLHRARAGSLLVRWQDIGDFLIESHGRRITAQPAPRALFGEFRDLLLTTIASFALLERGVEPLHASAVTWKGGAVAFVGGPGSGKSTLAALFARRGHSLLTDDLLPVHWHRRKVAAYPAMPEIKLEPEAARALGLDYRRLARAIPGSRNRKRYWQVRGAQGPRPLTALYFPRLSASGQTGIRLLPLSSQEAFRRLLGYNFNPQLQTRIRLKRQLAVFAHLANRVPARRLLIARDWKRLEEAGERIEQDLAEILS